MDSTPPVNRPKFARWLWERNIRPAQAAEKLDCSKQTILNICQPFGHPARTRPSEPLLERIVRLTGGEVTAGDFYPPHLNGSHRPGDPAVLAAARCE